MARASFSGNGSIATSPGRLPGLVGGMRNEVDQHRLARRNEDDAAPIGVEAARAGGEVRDMRQHGQTPSL